MSTVEFGLPFSLFPAQVRRRPFVTGELIASDDDPSRTQDHLFVIPLFPWLRQEIEAR